MFHAVDVEEGSGNVFADVGLPDAEERLAKAELAMRIATAIRSRRLTQAAVAALFEIDTEFRACCAGSWRASPPSG